MDMHNLFNRFEVANALINTKDNYDLHDADQRWGYESDLNAAMNLATGRKTDCIVINDHKAVCGWIECDERELLDINENIKAFMPDHFIEPATYSSWEHRASITINI